MTSLWCRYQNSNCPCSGKISYWKIQITFSWAVCKIFWIVFPLTVSLWWRYTYATAWDNFAWTDDLCVFIIAYICWQQPYVHAAIINTLWTNQCVYLYVSKIKLNSLWPNDTRILNTIGVLKPIVYFNPSFNRYRCETFMDKLFFDDKWEFADLANFSPSVTPPGPMYFDSYKCMTVVTPLLTHWSVHSHALSHWCKCVSNGVTTVLH